MGYRRDYLRPLAQCVEVDAKEVRVMGSNSVLLRAGRCFKRENGRFWSAWFRMKVAHHGR